MSADEQQLHFATVDCAVTGTLSEQEIEVLVQIILALLARDYGRVATLMAHAGWTGTDKATAQTVLELEISMRSALDPVLSRPLSEIAISETFRYLLHSAKRHNLVMKPSHALLIKTILNVEGLGKTLYPDLDIWPILERRVTQWDSPSHRLHRLADKREDLTALAKIAVYELPRLVDEILERLQNYDQS